MTIFPCPKPVRAPKKQPKPLKKTRVPKINGARRKKEFARCYHSKERVEWVKSLNCILCVAIHPLLTLANQKSENAHTVTGGAGRKAGYETIIPLCPGHHRRYDQHQAPCDRREVREMLKKLAAKIEKLWQSRTQGEVK